MDSQFQIPPVLISIPIIVAPLDPLTFLKEYLSLKAILIDLEKFIILFASY